MPEAVRAAGAVRVSEGATWSPETAAACGGSAAASAGRSRSPSTPAASQAWRNLLTSLATPIAHTQLDWRRTKNPVKRVATYGEAYMELSIGPHEHGYLCDVESAERAWGLYRERVLAEKRLPGHRRWAWWTFDAPDDAPDYHREDGNDLEQIEAKEEERLRYLAENGYLSPEEVAAIFERESEFKAMYPPGRDGDPDGRLYYGASREDNAFHGVTAKLRDARVVREAMRRKQD
jgi:hypothetical protein